MKWLQASDNTSSCRVRVRRTWIFFYGKNCVAILDRNRSYFMVHIEYIVSASAFARSCVWLRAVDTSGTNPHLKLWIRTECLHGMACEMWASRTACVLSLFKNKLVQEHHDALKFNLCSFHSSPFSCSFPSFYLSVWLAGWHIHIHMIFALIEFIACTPTPVTHKL